MNYNEMAQKIYAQNKAVGWWDDPDRCLFECLQLVSTEVAEATEAERKDLMDDHLPHRKGGEVEPADALIRVLDLGGRLGLTYSRQPRGFVEWYGNKSVAALHLAINRDIIKLADCLIAPAVPAGTYDEAYSRLIDTIEGIAVSLGYDLHGALLEKLEYNRQRSDHKRENRAKPGGKAF